MFFYFYDVQYENETQYGCCQLCENNANCRYFSFKIQGNTNVNRCRLFYSTSTSDLLITNRDNWSAGCADKINNCDL